MFFVVWVLMAAVHPITRVHVERPVSVPVFQVLVPVLTGFFLYNKSNVSEMFRASVNVGIYVRYAGIRVDLSA